MVKLKYWVFMQALLLTIVVFIIGMYIGVVFEENKFSEANAYFAASEVSLMDVLALNELVDSSGVDCDVLVQANFNLLDRVYHEAIALEHYESSGKITNSIKSEHKKYDILRTFIWINSIRIQERCETDYHNVIYLYQYNQDDLTKKAEQNVWSKILSEIKEDKGSAIVLIPIAADNELASLTALISEFDIAEYPAVIIDERWVFEELVSAEDLEKYLQ